MPSDARRIRACVHRRRRRRPGRGRWPGRSLLAMSGPAIGSPSGFGTPRSSRSPPLPVTTSVPCRCPCVGTFPTGNIETGPSGDRPETLPRRFAITVIDARKATRSRCSPTWCRPTCKGICSSGSTGTPKVILRAAPSMWDDLMGTPFLANWEPSSGPQRILVLAPMYHTNGFATLTNLLLPRSARGAGAVRRSPRRRRHRTPPDHQLHGHADDAATHRRSPRCRRARPVEHPVHPPRGRADATVTRPPVGWSHRIERIVMAYGMSEGLGLTAIRGERVADPLGSVGRGFRGTELMIVGDEGTALPPGEIGEVYLRTPGCRWLRVPRGLGTVAQLRRWLPHGRRHGFPRRRRVPVPRRTVGST